jgi:hypothetical protein
MNYYLEHVVSCVYTEMMGYRHKGYIYVYDCSLWEKVHYLFVIRCMNFVDPPKKPNKKPQKTGVGHHLWNYL